MAVKNRSREGEGIHIFRASGVDLESVRSIVRDALLGTHTLPPRASSAHWASASEGAYTIFGKVRLNKASDD